MFLMMRTLRDMNMSKFVAEDVPLFISLIEDLFPAQKAERASFPDITAALEKVRRGPGFALSQARGMNRAASAAAKGSSSTHAMI